jgi:hypothetical protein
VGERPTIADVMVDRACPLAQTVVPPQILETQSHYASEISAIFERLVERLDEAKASRVR